jgi:ribosomal-protein-serine acetyltransferase
VPIAGIEVRRGGRRDRVSLHTEVGNERSRALARRLGFVQEGILRRNLAFPGARRDSAAYSLLAAEWSGA